MRKLKIRHIIAGAMTLSILTITILLGFLGLGFSKNRILNQSKEKLTLAILASRSQLNLSTSHIEDLADSIDSYISSTFNSNNLLDSESTDESYFESYIDDLEVFLTHLDRKHMTNKTLTYQLLFNHSKYKQEEYSYGIISKAQVSKGRQTSEINISLSELTNNADSFKWYYEPIKSAAGAWLAPYYDSYVDKNMISYSLPIYTDNELIAVISIDVLINELLDSSINSPAIDDGYNIIMYSDYEFLYHPVYNISDNLRTVENGGLAFMIDLIKKEELGTIEYQYKGDDKILSFAQTDTGWYIATTSTIENLTGELSDMKLMLLFYIMMIIIVTLATSSITSNLISKPISKLTTFFKKVTSFDLTYSDEIISMTEFNNEFGELSRSIYNIIIDQSRIIKTITINSNNINDISFYIKEKISKLNELTRDQDFSLRELKKAIEEIALSVDASTSNMDLLSSKIGYILDGIEKERAYINKSQRIDHLEIEFLKSVSKLERISKNVSDFYLNYSLIAGKINETFGEFVRFDDDINDIPNEINDITREFNENIKSIQGLFQDVRIFEGYFDKLESAISEIDNSSKNIFVSIEEQTSSIEEVLSTTDAISDMSKIITKENNDINISAGQLKNHSDNMNKIVDKFKLAEEVSDE